jgi:hypothetical protein
MIQDVAEGSSITLSGVLLKAIYFSEVRGGFGSRGWGFFRGLGW